jgi:hypothetical protein
MFSKPPIMFLFIFNGAVELKGLLYEHLLPVWNTYTEGFPLEINDIIMRTKEWVEIKPLNPDQDVIARQFFKSGKGGLTFQLHSEQWALREKTPRVLG